MFQCFQFAIVFHQSKMQLSFYKGRLVLDQTFVPIAILLHDFVQQMALKALDVFVKLNPRKYKFNATFYMMKLNGSATHTHTISNFKLIGSPITSNNSTTFNGTATLTMKNAPVTDVPISIRLMNGHAISIWLDPLKTDKHFGNT